MYGGGALPLSLPAHHSSRQPPPPVAFPPLGEKTPGPPSWKKSKLGVLFCCEHKIDCDVYLFANYKIPSPFLTVDTASPSRRISSWPCTPPPPTAGPHHDPTRHTDPSALGESSQHPKSRAEAGSVEEFLILCKFHLRIQLISSTFMACLVKNGPSHPFNGHSPFSQLQAECVGNPFDTYSWCSPLGMSFISAIKSAEAVRMPVVELQSKPLLHPGHQLASEGQEPNQGHRRHA